MQFIKTLCLLGTVSASTVQMSARIVPFNPLGGLVERQITLCKPVPVPVTCEKSCGPGFVQCVLPLNCYNPSRGDNCCSNGKYCPAGTYCSDKGCCPDSLSLEECGATVTLSVIPPPALSTAAPEPSTSDQSVPEPKPTTSQELTTVPEPTTSEEATSDDTSIPEPTVSEAPTISKPTVIPEPTDVVPTASASPTSTPPLPTNGSLPTANEPVPTGAAAVNAGNAAVVMIGGLLANLLLL